MIRKMLGWVVLAGVAFYVGTITQKIIIGFAVFGVILIFALIGYGIKHLFRRKTD
jgi:hypothetical protein